MSKIREIPGKKEFKQPSLTLTFNMPFPLKISDKCRVKIRKNVFVVSQKFALLNFISISSLSVVLLKAVFDKVTLLKFAILKTV